MVRIVAGILCTGLAVLGAGGVAGQAYPSKPIRIYTGSPGGGNDIVARMIGQGISGPLGQPVIIENRSAIISLETVVKSPPDGYALFHGGDAVWTRQLLQGVQPDTEFLAPISMLGSEVQMIAAHPSLPVKSIKELIVLAKAKPRQLDYASSNLGTVQHLAGILLNTMAGTDIVAVSYKGTPASINAAIGGEVPIVIQGVGVLLPHVKSGKLRPLAVTSLQPSALAPGVPTVAASGVPGYEIVAGDSIFAPAKTPAAIVNRLNQEIVRYLKTPEAREKYLGLGADVVASSPEELAARSRSFVAKIGKLVKDNNLKVE